MKQLARSPSISHRPTRSSWTSWPCRTPRSCPRPRRRPRTWARTSSLGTGAYMIKSYNPNERIDIVRNPHFKEWSADAQPDAFADEISYEFGLTEEAAITAIQNGQADWMFDPPPADRLAEMRAENADQVHVNPLTAVWYAPLNVNLPPR